ncbi:MAG: hypothetical protein IPP83_09185 [Flavobacteriales bacterium]|nr:hypothetical protein [Flavobacteriales bacterium]
MKHTLFAALLLFAICPVAAQQPPAEPSSAVLQKCLLVTPPNIWAELKLSSDQLHRMKFVQEACREECTAAGAKGDPDSISHSDGKMVMDDVRNVLTGDQYRGWLAYCASRPTD